MTFLQGRQLVGNPNTSREEMLYNLRRADAEGLTNEATRNELNRKSVGGLSNWVANEALRIQAGSETPMSQADAIAAATQSQGYIRAINQQLGNNPSYMKYVAGHENRDMSAFDSKNPYKGFKFYDPKQLAHIVDSEGNPKYPNGAVNMEMNLRENTTTENVMNGLADWLPDGAREYIPGTRAVPLTKNATSAPDDPLDLISVEDAERLTSMRDTASRVNDLQALSGNTSTDTAAMRYMQRFDGKDGPNPYAPGLAYALQQNAYANTGVYDSQRQAEFKNVVQQPVKDKADKVAAYKQAVATAKGIPVSSEVLKSIKEGWIPKGKGAARTGQAASMIGAINNELKYATDPNVRSLLKMKLNDLKGEQAKGVKEALEGKFNLRWWELIDKWTSTETRVPLIGHIANLFNNEQFALDAGVLDQILSLDGTTLELIGNDGTKGDSVDLSELPPATRDWLKTNVTNINSTTPIEQSASPTTPVPPPTPARLEALQRKKALLLVQEKKAEALKQQEKQDVVSRLKKVTEQQLDKAKK